MRPTNTETQTDDYLPTRAVALVEGISDQRALQTLATRRGRNLEADGVAIVPMGGSKNIGSYLRVYGPVGLGVTVAGLCDAPEENDFRRALERERLGTHLTRDAMEQLGFYVCSEDLEDELIRALGTASVEEIVETQGELGSFRTFQQQAAQRGRSLNDQLRRFLGTRAGRKILYAELLVDALDLDRVPRPLDGVLAHL